MKLTPRQIAALREIEEFKGSYSRTWTKATCNSLKAVGLIEESQYSTHGYLGWRITSAGQEALAKVKG